MYIYVLQKSTLQNGGMNINACCLVTDEDIRKFFSYMPLYPQLKIDEFFRLKKEDINLRNKWYKNVKSGQQLKALITISRKEKTGYLRSAYGNNIASRLLNILCRENTVDYYYQVLKKIRTSNNDNEVYQYIKKKILPKRTYNKQLLQHYKRQAQIYKYHFRKYLHLFTNYLDIGCGSGRKTKHIATEFGIPFDKVFGIEIDNFAERGDWGRSRNKMSFPIKIIGEKDTYPFHQSKFTFVSAMMVLHHVKDLDFTLREINRVLKKDGYFFIKEHDCFNCIDEMLTDIEHTMYNYVYAKKEKDNFRETYYAKYYNWVYWDIIMHRYGFQFEIGDYISSSINFSVGATREFYGLYKKIKDL